MKRVFYVGVIISLVFIGCNNDDNSSSNEQEIAENFYALKIGNKWKYEYFDRIAQTDEFESTGVIEEVEIVETTIVNGETFYVFQSTTTGNINNYPPCAPANGIIYLNKRDSLGYLIDNNHHILFSNENLNEYLISENLWGDIYGELKPEIETINMPLGSFECRKNEIFAVLSQNEEIAPGINNYFYAENIGEIFKTFSGVSNPLYMWEKRLIEYQVQD